MIRFALVLILLSVPVSAMERGSVDCPERAVLVEEIERAGESRVAYGMKADGIVMELYASPGGSWTEIWTWPRGQSCVIGFGRGWISLTRPDST